MRQIERLIPPLIWGLFLFEGIRGGLSLPSMRVGLNPNLPLPNERKLVVIIFPFAGISLMTVLMPRRSRIEAIVKRLVDAVFSEGTYDRIASRLHFEVLAIAFLVSLE